MRTYKKILVVLGNQLFPMDTLKRHKDALIYMSEDHGACTYVRHHKHKLILILSAMRAYAAMLRANGYTVHYERLDAPPASLSYSEKLAKAVDRYGCSRLVHFEMQDKSMERRMAHFVKARRMRRNVMASPMFLTRRNEFAEWRESRKLPRMVDFYKWQRQRLGILVDNNGNPSGGRWSFDKDNRKALPITLPVPDLPRFDATEYVAEVKQLVQHHFPTHPGYPDNFELPTTRRDAMAWLNDFLEQRFTCFDDYEDALTTRSDHVFHSVLSPLLNIGLLTPREVVDNALRFAEREKIELNNVEGFIRQIIGWREFMFGIYCTDGATMLRGNFWGHQRRLRADWYQGTTGVLPLDMVICKANRIGWAHHVERLMIAGNMMLLSEVHPDDVYRWFMEMFVDSAEWVMVPNVYGMALFADGGTITTKPYVCGANYLRKMGQYPEGDWGTTMDGLFWRFIGKNRGFFARQPSLSMLCANLDKQKSERKRRLADAANQFLNTKTELMPEVA